MILTKDEACRFLGVPPSTLDLYVAVGRLPVSEKRTIRGPVPRYEKDALSALKRQLQEEEEFARSQYQSARPSPGSPRRDHIDVDADAGIPADRNRPSTSSSAFADRLLFLLEALVPAADSRVGVENKLMLSLAEAACYSGLPQKTLTQAIQLGRLKARKDLAKGYRIKRSDIETYVESL
jgi:excisionase family DNA binding protein